MPDMSAILGPFHYAICENQPETRDQLLKAGVSEEALAAMAKIHQNYEKSGTDYLFYRVTQLVKAIFGYSDWQIATRELRAHVAVHVLLDICSDPLFTRNTSLGKSVSFSPFIREVNSWKRTDRVIDRILNGLIGKALPLPENAISSADPTKCAVTQDVEDVKKYEESISAGNTYVEKAMTGDFFIKRYQVHQALKYENGLPSPRGVRPVDMQLYCKLLKMSPEEEQNLKETLAIEKAEQSYSERVIFIKALNNLWNTYCTTFVFSSNESHQQSISQIFSFHFSSPLAGAIMEPWIAENVGKKDGNNELLSEKEVEFLDVFLSDWKKRDQKSHLAQLFANRGKTGIAKMISDPFGVPNRK